MRLPPDFKEFLQLLNAHQVEYLLIGGYAVGYHGYPRATVDKAMSEIRLMTLDPGHFHAALVQKESLPGVSPRVHIYAPLGFDLIERLKRVAGFNNRKENPTRWELEVHAGDDFLARMLREKPGNVVVIAGRNQGKIDRVKTCVENGLLINDAGVFGTIQKGSENDPAVYMESVHHLTRAFASLQFLTVNYRNLKTINP